MHNTMAVVVNIAEWYMKGFPGGSLVKNLPANEDEVGLTPGLIPWTEKWQHTPVFLPGIFYGQRNLSNYSLWDRKRVWHNLATKT